MSATEFGQPLPATSTGPGWVASPYGRDFTTIFLWGVLVDLVGYLIFIPLGFGFPGLTSQLWMLAVLVVLEVLVTVFFLVPIFSIRRLSVGPETLFIVRFRRRVESYPWSSVKPRSRAWRWFPFGGGRYFVTVSGGTYAGPQIVALSRLQAEALAVKFGKQVEEVWLPRGKVRRDDSARPMA
jgi:hypothetical protein